MDQEETPKNHWEGSFPHHVPQFGAIEWIEFKPYVETRLGGLIPSKKKDYANEIVHALTKAGVPISVTKTGIRINAYVGS